MEPLETQPAAADRAGLFRLVVLALLLGQMFIYYDTAQKVIPQVNLYLLLNLLMVLLVLIPWRGAAGLAWALVWPLGTLMRWDWATRPTNSDVFWATSQAVDFLLRGLNPYTQRYTWVYQHQPGISNYPAYSYFPGGMFAEVPFYILGNGNVRLGLAVADIGTALLIYLLARPRLGAWPARALAAFWLLFLPGFQVAMLLGVLDFFLLFWIALAVWLYSRGWAVWSALAAAAAFATKQYGFLFAIPWGVLLLRPVVIALAARWRAGERSLHTISTIPRKVWIPPAAEAGFAVLLVLPLALLSPKAFTDATIGHHESYLPVAMLGTPQWNQSLAGQLVGLGWLRVEDAARIFSIAFPLLMVALLAVATLKIRDAASALMWSALLVGVVFAFNNLQVQFFYWRFVLLLFGLFYIMDATSGIPGKRQERQDAKNAKFLIHRRDAESAENQ